MPFTHDIFLSYAHFDDYSLDNSKGWATSLYERLNTRLRQYLGKEPKIWWDQRSQENKYVVDKIGDQISDSLLLTTILTPLYANSPWCGAELNEFCKRAVQTGGVELDGLARIFCAVKTPVEAKKIPKELQMLDRFEFYKIDANNKVTEFKHHEDANDPEYWSKFEDLVQAIHKTLIKLNPEPDVAPEPVDLPLSKKVYLAATSSDVQGAYDHVKRELLEQGYYVLPKGPLPLNAPDFESTVREDLSRCVLSVHIIGERYGVIPEGEPQKRSNVQLQLDLAAERAKDDQPFSRLVWMPIGVQGASDDQRDFIESLKKKFGDELLQSTVDDLRSRAIEKLCPKQSPVVTQGDPNRRKHVYLICDNRDTKDVKPIADYLFDQGFEVVPSTDQSDSGQLMQYNRESLVNCDGALIYYGHGDQRWLRLKMSDLLKASEWRGQRPTLSKAIYVSGPNTSDKQLFRTREAQVIENFDAFSPEALQPFISALNARNGDSQ